MCRVPADDECGRGDRPPFVARVRRPPNATIPTDDDHLRSSLDVSRHSVFDVPKCMDGSANPLSAVDAEVNLSRIPREEFR